MSDYLYIVKVLKDGNMYEYSYSDEKKAINHYKTEIRKGFKASAFRYKDGKLERLKIKSKCNCAACLPKVLKKILPISRAKQLNEEANE